MYGRTDERGEEAAVDERFWVGFDVGEATHWVSVLNDGGEEVLSRRVQAAE